MPQIIAAAIALLMGALREYLPGLIGRVALAFGIGLVAHEVAMPALKSFVESKFGALSPVLQAYWSATGIGVAVTIILSAWLANHSQRAILSKVSKS